jgi:hypothetical protein
MSRQSVTSLPVSPADDRRARMIRYCIAMGVRLLCVIACFFVQGWWLLLPALGAIVLPYVAVVLANVTVGGRGGTVVRPGAIVRVRPPATPVVPDDEDR